MGPSELITALEFARKYAGAIKTNIWDGLEARKHGQPLILICGRGGVGKTMLLQRLNGTSRDRLDEEYHMSPGLQGTHTELRLFCRAVALTGQLDAVEFEWNEKIKPLLEHRKRFLLVNCVCYGYSSPSEKEIQQFNYDIVYHKGIDAYRKTMQEYFSYSKKIEIGYIRYLFEKKVNRFDCKKRFITLITKKHMWNDIEKEVLDYYSKGPYAECMQKLLKSQASEKPLPHDIRSCVVKGSFLRDARGRVLTAPPGGPTQRETSEENDEFDAVKSFIIDTAWS